MNNHIQHLLIIIGAVISCGVIGAVWWHGAKPSPAVPLTDLEATGTGVAEPLSLIGFNSAPFNRQCEMLERLEGQGRLDAAACEFLMGRMSSKASPRIIRNHAANILTIQDRPVEGLIESLLVQQGNAEESPQWRDYALQHATTLATRGISSRRVVEVLRQEIVSSGPSAGTALLQWQRLEEAGGDPLPADLLEVASVQVFHAPLVNLNQTISLLGVLGQRGERRHLDDIRGLIGSPQPSVRRAALGALGALGGEKDLAAVRSAAADSDELVSRAADAAYRRLSARL